MSKHGPGLLSAGLAAALVVFATTGTCVAATTVTSASITKTQTASTPVQLAHAYEVVSRDAHPQHAYHGSHSDNSFNDEYVFGLTRGIAYSTMHPAAKILVFPMTVPLDLALLPFEVIAGLF